PRSLRGVRPRRRRGDHRLGGPGPPYPARQPLRVFGAMYIGHFDFSKPLLDTISGLIDRGRCGEILADLSGADWLPATVNSMEGRVIKEKIRDSTTAIVRDPALAGSLFSAALPHLPERMSVETQAGRVSARVVGLNLPLRVYRYETGQHFGLHNDQS